MPGSIQSITIKTTGLWMLLLFSNSVISETENTLHNTKEVLILKRLGHDN